MTNVTARPGQSASFKCQVDMSCIVAYIEWYHEMDNGTEKLIKVRFSFFSLFHLTYNTFFVNIDCVFNWRSPCSHHQRCQTQGWRSLHLYCRQRSRTSPSLCIPWGQLLTKSCALSLTRHLLHTFADTHLQKETAKLGCARQKQKRKSM